MPMDAADIEGGLKKVASKSLSHKSNKKFAELQNLVDLSKLTTKKEVK